MVATYTTEAKVAAILGLVNEDGKRPQLDSDVDPIEKKSITDAIEDAEGYIDNYCNTSWRLNTVNPSPELHSYDGQVRRYAYGILIQLHNKWILPFLQAEGDQILMHRGSGVFEDLVADGPNGVGGAPGDGDWFLDSQKGTIFISTRFPARGPNNIKFVYRWGQVNPTTFKPDRVPSDIRRATGFLAASYLIDAGFDWVIDLVETSSSMGHSEKSRRWEERAMQMISRRREVLVVSQY